MPMSGFFQLFNKKTGRKLADSSNRAIVYDGEDFDDQFWAVRARSSNFFKLENRRSRRWLADSGGSLVVFNGHHCDDQYWTLVPYPDGCFKLVNKVTGNWLAESSHGQACVFAGKHHWDQLWEARPDIIKYGPDLGSRSSDHVETEVALDESLFRNFAPLLAASQSYASHSGCRFSGDSFRAASAADVSGERVEAAGAAASGAAAPGAASASSSRAAARLEAAPLVREFADRLRAGERGLVEDLENAVAIESAESIRSGMVGVFRALEMFPPEPSPDGVDESDCNYFDESASLPIIAQRLYNDETLRVRSKMDGAPYPSEKHARTAAFLVEFAEESHIVVPETPEGLRKAWERFNERSSKALRRSRQEQEPRAQPGVFSLPSLKMGTIGDRLRQDAGKWWDSDVVWAAGVTALGVAGAAAALAAGAPKRRDG
eukprot:TRINITY_DN33730_c0_g1_i1.p1 TRINITY_DN33730_c0_g1~~TRINITY_DN33730_c0_g1_i1.p1  ORF type:complete len:432 (+),score=90.10 TRINITY_DN33730_c0_g1_i1:66-1361(+)